MQQWMITVIGVVLLSVLCDIIVPNGKTAKYIKLVLSLISIVVIANGIIAVFNEQYYLPTLDSGGNYVIDAAYIDYSNNARLICLEAECVSVLEAGGYQDAKINITATYNQDNCITITGILVELSSKTYNGNLSEVEKAVNKIGCIVSSYLGVDKGVIIICLV